MRKTFKHIIAFVCLMAFLVLPVLVSAESSATGNLKNVGTGFGSGPYQNINPGTNDLASIIGVVIKTFLGLLGVLFLVYMLYAGYNWMIAQGEEEKVTKAKDTIQRAIIGLIITIAAYAISFWVFHNLLFTTNITT